MAFNALAVADPVAGAVVDSISLGARLVWSCYQLWHPSRCAPEPNREEEACMSTRSTDGITAGPTTNRGRIRLVVFRVLAAVAGLFFLAAVVLAVLAPWVLLQPEDPNAAGNRWFLTVAGSVDAIAVVRFEQPGARARP